MALCTWAEMQSPGAVISWRSREVGEVPEVFSCEANYSQRGRNTEGVAVMNSVDYEL